MVTEDLNSHALVLPQAQRCILESLVRRKTCPQAVATRARVILAAGEGLGSVGIALRVGCSRELVRHWRARYRAAQQAWGADVAQWDEAALARKIGQTLSDGYRCGCPGKFTPEQYCQIMALACEKPSDSGRPVTNWTNRELADEAVQRGIVPSISPRQVGRFLKGGGPAAAQDAVLAEQSRPAASRGVCGAVGGGVRGLRLGHRDARAGHAPRERG